MIHKTPLNNVKKPVNIQISNISKNSIVYPFSGSNEIQFQVSELKNENDFSKCLGFDCSDKN